MRPFALAISVLAASIAACGDNGNKSSNERASGEEGEKRAASCPHCFTDDFSGPNHGWPTTSDDSREARRTGGVYRYTLLKPGSEKVAGPDQFDAEGERLHFADSVVSVSARVTTPREPAIGLVCRWNEDESSGYVFGAYKGGYELRLYPGAGKELKKLDVGQLPAGTDLSRPTKLEAACEGDQLSFSVDGKRVARVRDSSLAQGSDLVYIASTRNVPATAIFDDYEVR